MRFSKNLFMEISKIFKKDRWLFEKAFEEGRRNNKEVIYNYVFAFNFFYRNVKRAANSHFNEAETRDRIAKGRGEKNVWRDEENWFTISQQWRWDLISDIARRYFRG